MGVFVTTTGRKSGQPRTSPLIAVPVGDTLALIGTNFGQANTPAWVHNLEADASAGIRHDVPDQVPAGSSPTGGTAGGS